MLSNTMLLILGLAVLTIGAEGLVRGSATLAIRLGLTPLIVGLTVVAFGTSAPELVVSIGAALNNQGDIAIGNVVGSNIFNIGMILGLTALICPVKVSLQIIKYDVPIMIAATLLSVFFIKQGTVPRLGGTVLFSALIAYLGFTIRMAKKEVPPEIKQEFEEGVPSETKSAFRDFLWIGGGLLFLILGSQLFVTSATAIARQIGISEAIIGLTIIAAGTSMPELATSVVAAVRRQPDIAVGNVVGSNIFNLLGILGLTAIIKPLSASGITPLDLWVMLGFSIALLPLLYTGLKLQRWEGALLLCGYGLYLWILWP